MYSNMPGAGFHPGLTNTQLVSEVARGSKDQQSRILNVLHPDIAKQLRDVLDSQACAGGAMDVIKVDESKIVPAAKKSTPIELDPWKYMDTKHSAILEVTTPAVKPAAELKQWAIPPAPVAKQAVSITKPAATQVRDIIEAEPVIAPVAKSAILPEVTPVAKSAIFPEEPELFDINKSTLHPGLVDSDVLRIIDEGGARAERVISVITTGKAPAAVKTLSNQTLLLIGAAILIFYMVK